jgi:pentatricopeptide repeat protein
MSNTTPNSQPPLLPLINPSKSLWLQVTTTRNTDPVTALRRRAIQRTRRLTNVPKTNHTVYNAMSDMGEYLRQRPHEVGALHNQATNYLTVNRNIEAKRLLEKALSINSSHVPSLIDMANVCVRLKKPDMGLQFANAAISLAPHNCMAYNCLASCLARLGKYGKAIKIQQQALFYGPKNPSVHRNIAALYRAQGKNNNAIPHYESVRRLDPNDPENYKHYINALVSEGRKSETYNLAIKRNQLLGIKAARW